MRHHEGIRTHMCMGVEPHPIHLTSSKKLAKMEKGFTFEIPKKSRERLKKHFLKVEKKTNQAV